MKIIVTIPVKNDAWFVEKAVVTASAWADHVFVADENSDDGSHEIYDRLSKLYNVTFIRNRPKFSFNSPDLRNYLMGLARSFEGMNLIFELHADEVMSAAVLEPNARETLKSSVSPGSAVMFPWLTMWGKPDFYRDDRSLWSKNACWFGYCDDRISRFEGPVFHGPRAPESFLSEKVFLDNLCVLHYQFINRSNELSKQALYQVYERNHFPDKSVEHINKIYAVAFDTSRLKLKEIEVKHIDRWIELGVNLLEEYPDIGLNYRDKEVLRNFQIHGLERYKDLNIWYIDWEYKRKEALKVCLTEVPCSPINDPRDMSAKLAHLWVMRTQLYAFWRLDFMKLLLQKGPQKLKLLFLNRR